MIHFVGIGFGIYFLYTLNFAIVFNRTNTVLTDNQKLIHHFLIWIIPFFWIIVVKSMTKPTMGSARFKKGKLGSGFHESGIGAYGHDDLHDQHGDAGHGEDGGH